MRITGFSWQHYWIFLCDRLNLVGLGRSDGGVDVEIGHDHSIAILFSAVADEILKATSFPTDDARRVCPRA